VLYSYPMIGEAELGETFDVFRTLKLQLEDLKVEESLDSRNDSSGDLLSQQPTAREF